MIFTISFNHYEFDWMSFKLKNAFQRLMDLVLLGLQGEDYLFTWHCYICTSLEEHERKYNLLIDQLCKANQKLQPECEFLKTEVIWDT